MLTLAEDPSSVSEDWGILKDFLGFRLPHERESDGSLRPLTPPSERSHPNHHHHHHSSNSEETSYIRTSPLQHEITHHQPLTPLEQEMHSPTEVGGHHTTITVALPYATSLGLLHAVPLTVPTSNNTPLPSITTLVRHSSPNDIGRSCIDIHVTHVPMLSAPVDLSSIKTEYSDRNGPPPTQPPSQTSAFRSLGIPVTMNSLEIASPQSVNSISDASTTDAQSQGVPLGNAVSPTCEFERIPVPVQKTSASLLRELLVLGKPTRPIQSSSADQSRLGNLVRGGSMEQRWQDLASLLSLPSPDPSHHVQSPPTPTMASHATSPVHIHAHPPPSIHHPHALYPTHEVSPVVVSSSPGIPRGVLVHSASIPPTMSDGHNITYTNSIGASSHLVASSMNLTNNTEITASDHHHYKMETSSSLPPEMMYYQNSGAEMNQSTDGFLSSILSDEDLQLMDIPMNDYNGRAANDYGGGPYRYPPPEDPHRLPQVAQKKHQMFGKRFFHDNPHSNHAGHTNLTGNGIPSPIVTYPPHYQSPQGNQPMEGATAMDPSEMKYSCSMDFRSPVPEVSGAAVEHVQHNHTYHLSPDGSSGMNRSHGRDRKGRKSELEKSLTRDEKRARSMSLPITCEDIINLPMDEFNERISKFDLTEAQLSLIRDIRRRGKNKVAAQNCRKRKLDQIVHLAEEVKVIQYRKNELCSQLDHYTAERARIKHKFSLLYRHIFQSLRDPEGNPYSPHDYSLQQSADGGILLVPRSSPPPHTMDQINKGRMPKDDGGGH